MSTSRTALFPGTFDPFTNGHLDLTRRAVRVFTRRPKVRATVRRRVLAVIRVWVLPTIARLTRPRRRVMPALRALALTVGRET